MKKIILNIILCIIALFISFVIVFMLFVFDNLYTIGDIPTKLVKMRYIASSTLGGILLILFCKFYIKNKNNKFKLISGFTLIPFVLYFSFFVLVNMFPNNLSASSAGAIGIFIFLIFAILSIPCFILSIISLINIKVKKDRILSIISLVLWFLVIIVEIGLFI